MKVSLNWLADYVELPESVEELAHQLTMAGLEVEGIQRLGDELDGVVVAQIVESEKHPNAEKLSVTKVDAGELGTLQVVCGAKNFKVGDKVPLATVGTTLPGGTKIGQAALRGVKSFGMLCSEDELGLAEDASGLLILDPALKTGQPIADALGLRDVVLEVNVTPNRADCLSHVGIAREIAALTGKPLKLPDCTVPEADEKVDGKVKVRLEAGDRCPRYAARVLEGVTLGPSPMWMQNRLRAVGVRAISNAVDVTNYVMLELGQPLHAFDLDKVRGAEIVVRTAKEGEKLTTLDDKERTLTADDLVIADAEHPSALAGVMGGGESEVSSSTNRILLESAYFVPRFVRRTARRHGLHSESSHRFERGVDPEMVLRAQDRAAKLLAELCGGKVLAGRVDETAELPQRRTVTLRFPRISKRLGTEVPQETARAILERLGFGVKVDGEQASVEVSSWRGDVEGEHDLLEEVARHYGYDKIAPTLPSSALETPAQNRTRLIESRARLALASAGYDEVVNYSFVAPRELSVLEPERQPIALKNPLTAEQAVMRTTLLAGLLGNLSHSLNRQVEEVRLYELGRIYLGDQPDGASQPAREPRILAGVLHGKRYNLQWAVPSEPADFWDLKGVVEQILDAAGLRGARFVNADMHAFHPRSSTRIELDGRTLGRLGEIHPIVARQLDLPRGVYAFELDFEALVEASQVTPKFRGVPKFPAVLRDLAVVLPTETPAAEVATAIREAGGALVEEVTLFDVYRGENIPAGRKSLAFAIRYRDPEKTLSDEEAVRTHERIVKAIGEKFGAELRA